MKKRCYWLDETKPDYVTYHDEEWGVPVYDDHTLFEFITLESAQAGLSWYTILKKRAGYREAFYQFDVNQDLKKRGFKFLGPTTVYAYMQACGMVNDHNNDCFRKTEIINTCIKE